jgi:uncharacterized protein (TIGR02145 family)
MSFFMQLQAQDSLYVMKNGLIREVIATIDIDSITYSRGTSSFTIPADSLIDIDGNKYPLVLINGKFWMASNLKVSKNNDGSGIFLANSIHPSIGLDIYGRYYTYFDVASAKICPIGWKVPSKAEYDAVIALYGGYPNAGGDLKSDFTTQNTINTVPQGAWVYSATGGFTNTSGFTAVPSGFFNHGNNRFESNGIFTGFWTSTEVNFTNAHYIGMANVNKAIDSNTSQSKNNRFNIRCIQE